VQRVRHPLRQLRAQHRLHQPVHHKGIDFMMLHFGRKPFSEKFSAPPKKKKKKI
jgi:hypothetical protein